VLLPLTGIELLNASNLARSALVSDELLIFVEAVIVVPTLIKGLFGPPSLSKPQWGIPACSMIKGLPLWISMNVHKNWYLTHNAGIFIAHILFVVRTYQTSIWVLLIRIWLIYLWVSASVVIHVGGRKDLLITEADCHRHINSLSVLRLQVLLINWFLCVLDDPVVPFFIY